MPGLDQRDENNPKPYRGPGSCSAYTNYEDIVRQVKQWSLQIIYQSICNLLTFAGRLSSRPGAIGQAHPLRGAEEHIACGTAEVHLAADPKITLLPTPMRGHTWISTRP